MTCCIRSLRARALGIALLLGPGAACDAEDARDGFDPLAVEGEALVAGQGGVAASDLATRLASAFDRVTVGVEYISDSDYVFTAFVVELDPATPIDVELLRQVLPWAGDPPDPLGQPFVLPGAFEIYVRDDTNLWQNLAAGDDDPNLTRRCAEMERLMELWFEEQAIVGDQGSAMAQIIGVTMPDDVVYAPYFVIGRLPTGELVGLKTFRVWT